MNSNVEKIANAILYEGYLLYPYRRSAVKNRQRWNFGVVYPKAHSEAQKGVDSCFQQTECMVRSSKACSVDIKVRFLQAVWQRTVPPNASRGEVGSVSSAFGENPFQSPQEGALQESPFQETIEREIVLSALPLSDLRDAPCRRQFAFSIRCTAEGEPEATTGSTQSSAHPRESISGFVEVHATKCAHDAFRLTVALWNATAMESRPLSREDVLLRSFLSAHTILHVSGGEFISLTDPPADLRDPATACRNVGTWPVLVGNEGSHNEMLASPIILYDYPQIAPESPGDLFDSTEIDEILALRILTLSDDEKREIRQSDDRAREILDRTEMLPLEHFAKLHGVLRGMRPVNGANDESKPGGAQ